MIEQVKEIVRNNLHNPEAIFNEFFTFYEDIVCKLGVLEKAISEFPSPLKELIAAHQAWGVIGSDGLYAYFDSFDSDFDKEVKQGLLLLDKESCYNALIEASDIIRSGNELTRNEEEQLWNSFYEPIRNFDLIAGKYLEAVYG